MINMGKIIYFVLLLMVVHVDGRMASQGKNFSKLELATFAHSLIGSKINTRNFNVIVEKISVQALTGTSSLEGAEIRELTISPQQRDFEMVLGFRSGDQVMFSGKIEWLANIPILLRPIGVDEIINASDIGYHTYPVDQLNARIVMDVNDLVGKTSSHSVVKPGLPIERSSLKNPIIVKRGEIVDVVYRSSYLLVSAKARSTQDLAVGDTGTFETQSENTKHALKKISAKVVGPNTAEIIYGMA